MSHDTLPKSVDLKNAKFSNYSHNYQFNKSNKVKYIVINNDNNILQYNPSILTRLFIKNLECYFNPLLLVIEQINDKQIITIIPSTDIYLYYNCKRYIFLNCTGYKIENNDIDITKNVLFKYITDVHDRDNYNQLLNHKIYKYIFYILVKINGSNKVLNDNKDYITYILNDVLYSKYDNHEELNFNEILLTDTVVDPYEIEMTTDTDPNDFIDNKSTFNINEYTIMDINSECNV